MNQWPNLYSECIALQTEVSDKKEALALIANLAAKAGPLVRIGEKAIFQTLSKREKLGSTGLANGIAIPHCSFDDLTHFVIGVITCSTPIDFASLDGKPTETCIFLIGPTDQRNEHVRLLASIAKAVRDEKVRKELSKATKPEDVHHIFTTSIPAPESEDSGKQKSQLTLYIQKEEFFDELLEAVSSEADGSVAVIETENAHTYLYHMPLFAAFWSERNKNFSRVLIAIIDKDKVNSVLRRIGLITDGLDTGRGVMVTVTDLAFTAGSLDF